MRPIERFFANAAASPTLQAQIAASCGEKTGEDRLKALLNVAKSQGIDASIDDARAYVKLLAQPNTTKDRDIANVQNQLGEDFFSHF